MIRYNLLELLKLVYTVVLISVILSIDVVVTSFVYILTFRDYNRKYGVTWETFFKSMYAEEINSQNTYVYKTIYHYFLGAQKITERYNSPELMHG